MTTPEEERLKRIAESFEQIQKLLEELPQLIADKVSEEVNKINAFGEVVNEVDINDRTI